MVLLEELLKPYVRGRMLGFRLTSMINLILHFLILLSRSGKLKSKSLVPLSYVHKMVTIIEQLFWLTNKGSFIRERCRVQNKISRSSQKLFFL